MSRFALSLSLIASLSTAALATPTMNFAKAPPDSPVSNTEPAFDMPIQPDVVMIDRAAVRAKLAKNRAANLARFRVYQKKGVFPNNTYTDGMLNVWTDEFGNTCAAATIIKLSGQSRLVRRVAEEDNLIRLADVTDGPLMSWILTSGLTQDEIAAIQEPMSPVFLEPALEPDPVPAPILVDTRMRRAENRRLIAKYKQVDAQIVRDRSVSLDAATDRLMASPDLAASFLRG